MRLVSSALAPLLLGMFAAACNTASPGECWPNTSGGFGGSGTIPIGAGVGAASSGDFISPPPYDPLGDGDGANPCIEPQSPCDQKCLDAYANQAAGCGAIGDEAQRRACQDGAFASYKSCREGCVQINSCRKDCEDKADACEAECRSLPKDDKTGRQKCWVACTNAFSQCVKKCKD